MPFRSGDRQLLRAVDDSAAHRRQRRPDALDLGNGHSHVVAIEHDEVGLFADFERAESLFLNRAIAASLRTNSGQP
jgi:hypothetical protein